MRVCGQALACAALAVGMTSAALADTPSRISPFSVKCVETGSTGFTWEKDAWAKKNFDLETMIVRKIASNAKPQGKDDVNYCLTPPAEEPPLADDFATMKGCYGIAIEGEAATYDWCTEYYNKDTGQWRLDMVGCTSPMMPRIRFVVNGPFIASDDQVNFDRPQGSIFMSIGRCNLQ